MSPKYKTIAIAVFAVLFALWILAKLSKVIGVLLMAAAIFLAYTVIRSRFGNKAAEPEDNDGQ